MSEQSLGSRIAAARKRKGWTQEELAGAVGDNTHKMTVSKWERGENVPSVANLKRLADELGVTLGELMDGPPPDLTTSDASTNGRADLDRKIDEALAEKDPLARQAAMLDIALIYRASALDHMSRAALLQEEQSAKRGRALQDERERTVGGTRENVEGAAPAPTQPS